jgi:hypothetical protein
MAGGLLGLQAHGADEAIAVLGPPAVKADHVHHAVAVERVIAADRVVHRVFGIAQIDAIEVVGQIADHVEVGGVVLGMVRPPGPGAVGMVVVHR